MDASSFQNLKTIGRGAYGIVYLAKSKQKFKNIAMNQLVVVKVIPKKRERSIMREIVVSWK